MSHRSALYTLLLLGAASAWAAPLQGCIVAAVGAGGAGAGYALSQERSLGDTARDAGIRAAISKSWRDYNYKLAEDLDATVYEGRVLVTGTVPSVDWQQEAVKRTWQTDGVKEVYNEIQIGPEEGFKQDMSDTAITTKLRAALVADADVKSLNYTITTVNGVVYIIGSARSQGELDGVVNHARNTANVRRVVSYVRIRTGETPAPQASGGTPANAPSAAPTSASSAAPAAGGTPDAAPTPRQSIEVTPLQ